MKSLKHSHILKIFDFIKVSELSYKKNVFPCKFVIKQLSSET